MLGRGQTSGLCCFLVRLVILSSYLYLLSFIHLIQLPAALFSSETRHKAQLMQYLMVPRFVSDKQHPEKSAQKSNLTWILMRSQKRLPRQMLRWLFQCYFLQWSNLTIKLLLRTFSKVQRSSSYFYIPWRLLRTINQCLLWSSRFWWPGHRSVPVRHKHVQIRWRVPANWKHGDLHLWL